MALWDMLQRALGINRREAIAVTAVVGLLAAGALLRWAFSPTTYPLPSHLQRLLDSLALAYAASLPSDTSVPTPLGKAPDTRSSQVSSSPNNRGPSPLAPVNINTATKAELMSLPGIGEVTAERILEYRRRKPFESPEELLEIKGIGPKKLERLRPYIRLR